MKSKKRTSTKNVNTKNTHFSFVHDILIFLSYFINNYLYYCYSHVFLHTFMSFLNCIYPFYDSKYKFTNKLIELSISYIIVYTWLRRFSSKFDGYAFQHIFYYKYRIINFRTLASASVFGFMYKIFSNKRNDYNIELKKTLYKMIESDDPFTIMDSFVYSMISKKSREYFFKNYVSPLMLHPLRYEDKNYELLEKYVAMLFECFIIELTFSIFVYVMSSLTLKIKGSNKSNLAFCSFVRNAFVTSGNIFLKNVDGTITLDESKSVVIFFNERNVPLLIVRLVANMVGAFIVPVLLPMPKIMSLYDYKDIFPNSKYVNDGSICGLSEPYYVNSNNTKWDPYYTPWPNSLMGRLFSRVEKYVNNKKKYN
ncbi:hypothetical protein MACJ_003968 [Theileria orientalis]|uniref:Uncharacterized protein n=1 Tax=Theileria orientalis TaxID=68886 RepID=A0A976SKY5_THEOR|nr:hypothetical protein MACJ_003968 [Theileria orientalis]